jgi:23S rRNA (adenine2503-C2)-methyltransferase
MHPPPLARTPEEWAKAVSELGGRPFHGKQVFRWLQARGVLDAERMSDLPAALRGHLTDLGDGARARITYQRRATDGTRKLLLTLHDGATIETVLIPGVTGRRGELPSPVEQDADASAVDEDEEDPPTDEVVRVTQCISTQVGCAMGCVFCASGVAGLKRHLGPDEIVGQVLMGRTLLEPGEQLRNVVYMGMGEPLANYDATARSLKLLTHPDGIGLSTRRVTVSTSGLVPEIARLGEDFGGNIGLAISLHAADDETRTRLMPINKKYPLAKLIDALRRYPLPRRRRITIEYTLVAGKNDSIDEARKLSRLLLGLPVKVNLIPMNPLPAEALREGEVSNLGPPTMPAVLAFQRVLCDDGYSCFIRRRRGDDVAAACGQLALLGAKPKVRVSRS